MITSFVWNVPWPITETRKSRESPYAKYGGPILILANSKEATASTLK